MSELSSRRSGRRMRIETALPPSPVPEPHTWALLAGGLTLLVMRARRAATRQV